MRVQIALYTVSLFLGACTPRESFLGSQNPEVACPAGLIDQWWLVSSERVGLLPEDACVILDSSGEIRARTADAWYNDDLPRWRCAGPDRVDVLDYGYAVVTQESPDCWYVEARMWWGAQLEDYVTLCNL